MRSTVAERMACWVDLETVLPGRCHVALYRLMLATLMIGAQPGLSVVNR